MIEKKNLKRRKTSQKANKVEREEKTFFLTFLRLSYSIGRTTKKEEVPGEAFNLD